MGAMVGAFFGYVVNLIFPEITADPGAYALVAMGGMVAGTTRAPITAIIIVFELTKKYEIILPLMITCIISMIISSRLSRESIYTLKLLLRNINIKEGAEINVMESIFTKEVYTDDFASINLKENFSQVVNKMVLARGSVFPVVNDNGKISGVITTNGIKDYLFEKDSLSNLLIAGDIQMTEFETVTPEDNCQAALDRMRKHDFDGIPVVDVRNPKYVLGMIWLKDIQDAYQREIERRDITSSLASSISMKDEETHVHFIEGYSITEIKPPASFINKSIKELNIRAKFGVDVLSIKTKEKRGEKIKAIPSPDYIITENDTLVVAGEIRNINLLKHID